MRKFERLRHIRYFTNSLQSLPKQYSSADTNRLTLVHFCVQSLDILGCLPDAANCCGKVDEDVYINSEAIIEWIYGLQTVPTVVNDNIIMNDENDDTTEESNLHYVGGGFKGGTYLGPTQCCEADQQHQQQQQQSIEEGEDQPQSPYYDHSHLAMTYVAICTLVALGDDLSRIHKRAILQTLQSLQKEDGSFVAISSNCMHHNHRTSEADTDKEEENDDDCDLRFMYTAIAIWYLLKPSNNNDDDDSQPPIINIQTATSYILSCISYDGSLGLTPGREGHGGSTFCGIASLYLMGMLDDVMEHREELKGWKDDLIRWCVTRQYSLPRTNNNDMNIDNDDENDETNNVFYNGEVNFAAGMQGRPNKLQDTCYSYWIGGTLHLLSESHLFDGWALREYVLTCQSPYGGFGKVVGAMPDLLHSFYSLAWLSLSAEQGCCCEEEEMEDGDGGDENDDKQQIGYDTEIRQQVTESIHQLSKLDCALGVCVKRRSALKQGDVD